MARMLLASMLLVTAVFAGSGRAAEGQQAPSQQGSQPQASVPDGQDATFRTRTDLLTLDVSVLDGGGRPVQGLQPADFTITINGQNRRVVVAELVTAGSGPTAVQPGATGDRSATAIGAAAAGRRILIAVDQLYIPPGAITPLLKAAAVFVDRLTSRDQAAFVVFPSPGPHVDFTSDKALVRQAMQGLVGQPRMGRTSEFDIGLAEALTINDKERYSTNQVDATAPDPPVVEWILERSCPPPLAENILRCRRQIIAESTQIAQEARIDARISIRTLESIIKGLVPLDGTKSLILISASLAIDDRKELDTLFRLAEAARLSLNVILVDVPRENRNANRNASERSIQVPTEVADRRLLAEGLQELVADGRGDMYRLAGTGEGILDQLAMKLSASYVLGVESRAEDLNDNIGKVGVTVRRQGVRSRVSQAFVRTAAPVPRSLEDTFRDTLSATTPVTELPVRFATFSRWDPDSDKVGVSIAVEIGSPGLQPGDFMVGYVVTDQENRKVVEWSQKQTLGSDGSLASKPLDASMLLTPGVYSLQLGIVEQGGRRGRAVREVSVARAMPDGVGTSDLNVGNPPAKGEPLALSVEPRITGNELEAYLELYSGGTTDLDWTFVTFEIARDAESPALASETADMDDGRKPSWRVATGVVDVSALPPGRYVARARIVRDEKTLAVKTRPFALDRLK